MNLITVSLFENDFFYSSTLPNPYILYKPKSQIPILQMHKLSTSSIF